MTSLLSGLGGSIAFTILGAMLLLGGFLLTDWLTPGDLRRQIWLERNRNAAVFLSSAVVGIALIVFTSIVTTSADLVEGLITTAVFGGAGLMLMAAAFWMVDALTPGRLGEIIIDPQPHPAVWVSSATNLAVALIVAASIS
jgi:uncharacterized membrane protein YjfL (UPF0719 family)